MKTETKDGAVERRIVIAAITSTEYLARLSARLPDEPLRSRWANLVLKWCVEHYGKYQVAPKRQLESLFDAWTRTNGDTDTQKLVERFLGSLSKQYAKQMKSADVKFLLDLTEGHLNEVAMERVQEELKDRLAKGAVESAITGLESFRRVTLLTKPPIDVLRDAEAQKRALEEKQQVLVKYPGAAGQFFGNEFSEDAFIGVMAQAKGGKSYTLLDIAWRAVRQGRKVAYFQVGDLSQNQVMRRFHRRAVYRSLYAKVVKMPIGIVLPPGNRELARVDFEDKTYESDISWNTADRAFKKIANKTKGSLRLSYHPIRTINVLDIRNILEGWDRDGWKASVVILDYAYNLAPISPKLGPVDQVSETWAFLRQLSEVRNCCVITAHQSNKEGFSSWVLTRKNMSESKMILAHVTAFIGVNMMDEEKANGIIRYNFLVRRENQFSESYCLYAASCLDVANPIVVSTLPE